MSPLVHKILMQGAVAGMAAAADDAIVLIEEEIKRLKAEKAGKAAESSGKPSVPRPPVDIDSFPPSIITKGMRHVLEHFYGLAPSASKEQAAEHLFRLFERKQIDLPTIAGIVEKTLPVKAKTNQTTTQ
jgi:hypothetical protein